MNILWKGFAANNHSWAIVTQHICRELIKKKYAVDIFSTNGKLFFPKDLKLNLLEFDNELKNSYMVQLSYTAMLNFKEYLSHGRTNRFGIWNYEFPILPSGHAKYHIFADKILPSSEFSYQIFAHNKVPLSKLHLIHHGIDLKKYQNAKPMQINSKKSFKILVNIAQPHIRKNLPGMLEAFGKAFNKKDDVCLLLKIVDKKPEQQFEISFSREFEKFKRKFPNHAEIILFKDFIDDIESLYASCDAVFTMSHAEAFYLPGLEGLACGKIVIAPRYGGQLDFLFDNNSLLINGSKIRAPLESQYWSSSPYNEMFNPDINDAVEKLKFAYNNKNKLLNDFSNASKDILNNFTWQKVTNDIISLVK